MKNNLSKFPSTTVPNAKDEMTLDKALDIISDICTWRDEFKKELEDILSFRFSPCKVCRHFTKRKYDIDGDCRLCILDILG